MTSDKEWATFYTKQTLTYWRRVYAGQIMAGYFGNNEDEHADFVQLAEWSVDAADALIHELEKKKEEA